MEMPIQTDTTRSHFKTFQWVIFESFAEKRSATRRVKFGAV